MSADSWTFVQVDPTAPKKRRKKRKQSHVPSEDVRPELVSTSSLFRPDTPQFGSPTDHQHNDESVPSGDVSPNPDAVNRSRDIGGSARSMNDFDRFLLLSNEQDAAELNWTELFGENNFTSWTPMATTPVESALFDFCESFSLWIMVSFD